MPSFGSARLDDDIVSSAPIEGPGEFSKGLRSGALGMESQLKAFAGGAGAAMGFDKFAADRYAASAATAQQAQAAAPRVSSFRDVASLRDGADYVAGLAGQALPSIGLGVGAGIATAATGGGALAALGAGALTQVPFETGDVLQRQQLDPTARARGAVDNFGQALGAGTASAIGQSIVPTALGGKLVGAGLRGGLRSGAGGIGRAIGKDALVEGASEAGGEVVKQQGVEAGRAVDWDPVLESAVGGAIVGGGMGGVGGFADAAHANKGALVGGAQALADRASARLKPAETATAPVGTPVEGTGPDWQGLAENGKALGKEAYKAAMDYSADMLGRFKKAGTPTDTTGDAVEQQSPLAGLTPEEQAEIADPTTVRERATELLNKGVSQVSDWARKGAEALAQRGDLSDEDRAQAQAVVDGTAGEEGGRWVAAKQKALAAVDTAKGQISSLGESLGKLTGSAKREENRAGLAQQEMEVKAAQDAARARAQRRGLSPEQTEADVQAAAMKVYDRDAAEYEASRGRKKSEDFSGVRDVIKTDLLPLMPEAVKGDDVAVTQLAEHVRRFMDIASQPNNSVALEHAAENIRQVLGGDTEAVDTALLNLYMKVGLEDPRAIQQFAQNLSGSRAGGASQRKLLSTVMGALPDNLKDRAQEYTQTLVNWARGEGDTPVSGDVGKLRNDAIRTQIKKDLGAKADVVLDAVQKHLEAEEFRAATGYSQENSLESDEAGDANPRDSKPEESQQLFANKYSDQKKTQPIPMQNPVLQNARAPEGQVGATQKLLDKLTKQYPDSDVRWVSQKEETGNGLDTHGFIKVTDKPAEGVFLDKDWAAMRLDQKKVAADAKTSSAVTVQLNGKDPVIYGLNTGTTEMTLDAVRMARAGMDAARKTKASDGATDAVRLARGFFEAVAQATEQFGAAPKISGSTVIGTIGDQPFTAAMAKKADPRTEADVQRDLGERKFEDQVKKLREAYKNETDPDQRKNIRAKATALLEGREDAKSADMIANDPDENNTVSEAQELLEKTGRYEAGTDQDIVSTVAQGNRAPVQEQRGELRAKAANGKPWMAAAAGLEDVNAAGKTLAARITRMAMKENINSLSAKEQQAITDVLKGEPSVLQVAAVVNPIFNRLKDVLKEPKVEPKTGSPKRDALNKREETPRPKAVAAQVAALEQAASSSDPALLTELGTTTDAAALQRTAAHLAQSNPDSDAMSIAGERFDALVQDPDTAYSLQRAAPGQAGPVSRQDVMQYLHDVLGNSVAVAWSRMPHAGEFERSALGDVIRLSVHALNPKSVAYHEALHAFFAQVRDAGEGRITQVLEKAASQKQVRDQMNAYFKNEPAVLQQIRESAEERAAYMYQLWAQGSLKLNPQATTVFAKLAEFIRSVLGIWSNDQRALHILEHFHSGEYAKNIGTPDVAALLRPGTNAAIETARSILLPATRMAETIFAAGSSRLDDTGIASLVQIRELIKPALTSTSRVGFLEAARGERAARMNALAADLGGVPTATLESGLKALQQGVPGATTEAEAVRQTVYEHLQRMKQYMDGKGVKMGDLGPEYFPRVWDPSILTKKPAAFLAMMDKYVQNGMYKGDPQKLLNSLVANDGNNFAVDTGRPGFQSGKERELSFLDPKDVEPFLSKDLYRTLNNYVSQATRRAEFAERFGANGEGLRALLAEAKREGATPEQLDMAQDFLRGVTGTLGDDISPQARRVMGNVLVYQNLRLLPLAIFSSIVDPLGIAIRGGTVGEAFDAFKRGVREIPKGFRGEGTKDWATEMAETLGTVDNAALMSAVGALHTQGMVGDTARKVNDTLFKYNLMEQYNRSMRVAATETAMKFIERHAAGVHAQSARWLDELGLQARDVQIDPSTGRLLMTEDDGLSAADALKMRTAVNKWVDGAVLRPDAADRPVWFNDPRFMLISHLKSFVYAFHHTILERVVHEARLGNYKPLAVMGSYVPVMIAADYLKGMVQGGGDQPAWKKGWGADDWLWSGVQRAGLLGVGQFGVDVVNDVKMGGVGIGALTGPTVEQLADVATVAGGRGRFDSLVLKSLPANALYKETFKGGEAEE